MLSAKVSVIIPTYNVEDYLEECLDSVCKQTLKELEIICVNDGSTDRSLEIIKRYAASDDRIIIINKENGGYGKAMNDGLDKATGEYIGIVEPDDYIRLDMFEDLYCCAEENSLDFVKSNYYDFQINAKNRNVKMTHRFINMEDGLYGPVLNPSEREDLILKGRSIANWTGIYRRSFIEEHHIRHNETPGAAYQDTGFFWQVMTQATRAMFLDKAYYYHRMDNPNSSTNNKAKAYSINVEYDFIRDNLKQLSGEKWDQFKYCYNVRKYRAYIWTEKRIGKELKKEYINSISRELSTADRNGEIDMELFDTKSRERCELLIKDANAYFKKYEVETERKQHIRKTKIYRAYKALVRK